MNINSRRPGLSSSGASAIIGVRSYGFIDLEGAKVSAIIVEYGHEILARGVDAGTFAISDYTIRQILLHGRESAIERAGETAAGNEGDEEIRRGKLGKLKNPWLGRDANGKVRDGSGTAGLNSAQFTPHGPDPAFGEGWKPMPGLSRRCPRS